MDPLWFCSLDPDPHLGKKLESGSGMETIANPQHCFKISWKNSDPDPDYFLRL
jgi:hypothetical protein